MKRLIEKNFIGPRRVLCPALIMITLLQSGCKAQSDEVMALHPPPEVDAAVEIITESAEGDSDFAYAIGQLLITDAESAVHKNRFVLVFKNVDSKWKMHVDSWTPQ